MLTHNKSKTALSNRHTRACGILCLIISILLLVRDAYSVEINKFVFVAFSLVCVCLLKSDQMIYLLCFVVPLYVGLPGNYMTIVFLVRLLVDYKKAKISPYSLFFAILIAFYIFAQNIATGYTDIQSMIYIPSVFMICFFLSERTDLDRSKIIFYFSMGVATLGVIMLVSTLQVFEFKDLLSSSYRLGDNSTDYADPNTVHLIMDPNFYGMFAISAISMGIATAREKWISVQMRIGILVSVCICAFIGLLGLSRGFAIVLVVWVLVYLLTQRNFKSFLFTTIGIAVIAVAIFNYFPDIVEVLVDRFTEEDLTTGNGRVDLIESFSMLWSKNVFTIFFGVGLFACNVHCMPLQFLFGGGCLMALLVFLFLCSMTSSTCKIKWVGVLPVFAVLIMSLAIPAAGSLNGLFPLIVAGMNSKIINRESDVEHGTLRRYHSS